MECLINRYEKEVLIFLKYLKKIHKLPCGSFIPFEHFSLEKKKHQCTSLIKILPPQKYKWFHFNNVVGKKTPEKIWIAYKCYTSNKNNSKKMSIILSMIKFEWCWNFKPNLINWNENKRMKNNRDCDGWKMVNSAYDAYCHSTYNKMYHVNIRMCVDKRKSVISITKLMVKHE